MKTCFAALIVLLVLFTLACSSVSHSEPEEERRSSIGAFQSRRLLAREASSSETLRDIPKLEKNPMKQAKDSFRKIPRSGANPTQNKSKPRFLG
ncbi:hypothetical protein H6P81_010561 [Aristolochia fimbriata]|uniref:Uncharacterized protein n=1 Tax=Aristolochia fimbriata TaxID=158543 RepID=A0AAV7ERY6_ARIFI|nr:hypothetical protein H6P81_010561 [Aristolochia fimbriata]